MNLEWDEAKRQINIAVHGVDFVDAAGVLGNVVHLRTDRRNDYGERRFVAYGILRARLMVCIYTKRSRARRIISLRKANRRERDAYREV